MFYFLFGSDRNTNWIKVFNKFTLGNFSKMFLLIFGSFFTIFAIYYIWWAYQRTFYWEQKGVPHIKSIPLLGLIWRVGDPKRPWYPALMDYTKVSKANIILEGFFYRNSAKFGAIKRALLMSWWSLIWKLFTSSYILNLMIFNKEKWVIFHLVIWHLILLKVFD